MSTVEVGLYEKLFPTILYRPNRYPLTYTHKHIFSHNLLVHIQGSRLHV